MKIKLQLNNSKVCAARCVWCRWMAAAFFSCSLISAMATATEVWSDCQIITAVSNEPGLSSILLALSPGILGCAAQGVTGAVNFTAAQDGIASTDLSGLLATSLSAFALGKRVTVAYDNSSSNCYGNGIAIGGYFDQCP